MLSHRRFGRKAYVGSRAWLVDPSRADQIDTFPVRKGGNNVVSVGQDGEVEAREKLDESERG